MNLPFVNARNRPELGFGVEIEIVGVMRRSYLGFSNQREPQKRLAEALLARGEKAFSGVSKYSGDYSRWYITHDASIRHDSNTQSRSPDTA